MTQSCFSQSTYHYSCQTFLNALEKILELNLVKVVEEEHMTVEIVEEDIGLNLKDVITVALLAIKSLTVEEVDLILQEEVEEADIVEVEVDLHPDINLEEAEEADPEVAAEIKESTKEEVTEVDLETEKDLTQVEEIDPDPTEDPEDLLPLIPADLEIDPSPDPDPINLDLNPATDYYKLIFQTHFKNYIISDINYSYKFQWMLLFFYNKSIITLIKMSKIIQLTFKLVHYV